MEKINCDIFKTFTGYGNYRIDVAWDYLERWIEGHTKIELNPDFQRGHVWSEEQQISYIEYIMRGGLSGRELFFNSKGWNEGKDNPVYCVDGLQRITAVRRFLNDEFKIFGKYLCSQLQLDMMNHRFSVHVNDLETRGEVLKWYIELNSTGVSHTPDEIDKVVKLLEKETSTGGRAS